MHSQLFPCFSTVIDSTAPRELEIMVLIDTNGSSAYFLSSGAHLVSACTALSILQWAFRHPVQTRHHDTYVCLEKDSQVALSITSQTAC